MMPTAAEWQVLIRGYVLLTMGALGCIRIFIAGIGTDPLLVGLVAALLGVVLIPGKKG